MKATKILMSLLALIVFAGCSTETIDENTKNLEKFTVIASHIDEDTAARMWIDSETRATISADDKNMWESGDKLAFAPAGGAQCTLTATSVSSDGKTAVFEGEGASFPGVTTFYAAYPSTATIATDGRVTYSIASTQDGSTQSAMLLYGEGVRTSNTEIEVNFRPVAAILHVTTSYAMDRIVVESCNGENIAGSFYNDGTFSGSSTTITVDPAGTATDFYVALPAATLAKGYMIHYYKDAGSDAQMLYSYNYNSGTSFEAGKGYKVNFTRDWSPISVTLGARSSYSFYEDGDITAANACNAETIYFSNTTVNGVALNCASSYSGISSTLVSECGFIISNVETPATYDAATKTFSIANKADLAWGTNKMEVTAYIKHNGIIIAKSASRMMHITGLPYKADGSNSLHKINTGITYAWSNESSSGNIKWYDTSVYMEGRGISAQSKYAPKVASPYFSIPSSTSVRVKSTIARNAVSAGNSYSVATYSTSGATTEIYNTGAQTSGSPSHSVDETTTFTSSVNRILYRSTYTAGSINTATISNVSFLYN